MKKSFAALSALSVAAWMVLGCGDDEPAAKAKTDAGADKATQQDPSDDMPASPASEDGKDAQDPRGIGCKAESSYPGDKTCLAAPAPGEGMQIHVGPSDYNDQEQLNKFVLHPGEERSECWTFHTPNDEQIYYQTFVLSGRPGTHHIINTMYKDSLQLNEGGFTVCADGGVGTNSNIIDNMPGASKAFMPRGHVAPENEHVGRKIPAHALSQADMHYFNYTDHDILREFWMNIYFVKNEQITEAAEQIRGMGGFSWNSQPIAPGTDQTYSYSCPITGSGRIISLLGHYHSHGRQFTASLKRKNGDVQKVFEMYDYMDPATFEYDSMAKNPMFTDSNAGATSGRLDVEAGDTLMWDCHIVNDSNVGLTYKNDVKAGEMCNLWGSSVGITKFNCLMP